MAKITYKGMKDLLRGLYLLLKGWCERREYQFIYVWFFFGLLLFCGILSWIEPGFTWHIIKWGIRGILIVLVVFLLWKPMNVVYGLIGTRGSISMYLGLMVLINILFGCIYHLNFFKDAGITYDINQPYISFGMFTGKDAETCSIQLRDTSDIYDLSGNKISYTVSEETHNYQKVGFWYVLKNTFMTSLMQEPSDFFAIASTYNRAVDEREKDILGYKDSCKPICCCKDCNCRKEFGEVVIDPKHNRDQQKSELFHWLLILQVFISWIFFGVFISILYNKFRYES